jgi:hypothetical protein
MKAAALMTAPAHSTGIMVKRQSKSCNAYPYLATESSRQGRSGALMMEPHISSRYFNGATHIADNRFGL